MSFPTLGLFANNRLTDYSKTPRNWAITAMLIGVPFAITIGLMECLNRLLYSYAQIGSYHKGEYQPPKRLTLGDFFWPTIATVIAFGGVGYLAGQLRVAIATRSSLTVQNLSPSFKT